MNSVPDDAKDWKPSLSETWRDRYRKIGINPDIPDINGLEYLITHLNALGWVSSNGMGITSISFQEIQAYNELTNSFLSPDEVIIIKQMSSAYCQQLQDKDPHKKSPFSLPKN